MNADHIPTIPAVTSAYFADHDHLVLVAAHGGNGESQSVALSKQGICQHIRLLTMWADGTLPETFYPVFQR